MTIGVDVGGTKILGGLVDEQGQIVGTTRRPTPRDGAMEVLEVVADVVNELAAREKVAGVGVGIAGAVDTARSTIIWAPNLHWADVPAREVLEGRTGLRVVVENDGNAAAWGEFRFGAGHGLTDMVMVTVGTGVGGGIINGGRILRAPTAGPVRSVTSRWWWMADRAAAGARAAGSSTRAATRWCVGLAPWRLSVVRKRACFSASAMDPRKACRECMSPRLPRPGTR